MLLADFSGSIPLDHWQFFVDARHDVVEWDLDAIYALLEKRRVVATPNGTVVATARFAGTAEVRVEIHDAEPPAPQAWDAVENFEINSDGGSLKVFAPEMTNSPDVPTLPIAPGHYRGRVFFQGPDAIADDLSLTGDDRYVIQVWPSSANAVESTAAPT